MDAAPGACPPNYHIEFYNTATASWEEVTDSNRNVLPGQQIQLKIDCGGQVPGYITWTLPGQPFKNYQADANTATLTHFEEADFHNDTITFYWADTGDGRTVDVDFTIGGTQYTCHATFNVKQPVWSLTAIQRFTRFNADHTYVGLLTSP
jgi:hypothetical protein